MTYSLCIFVCVNIHNCIYLSEEQGSSGVLPAHSFQTRKTTCWGKNKRKPEGCGDLSLELTMDGYAIKTPMCASRQDWPGLVLYLQWQNTMEYPAVQWGNLCVWNRAAGAGEKPQDFQWQLLSFDNSMCPEIRAIAGEGKQMWFWRPGLPLASWQGRKSFRGISVSERATFAFPFGDESYEIRFGM